MLQKITKINPWHFLWVSVVLSEIFTLVVSTLLSNLFWGHTIYQVLIVGAIDALFVPLLIVPMIIFFVFQISRLRQELNSRKESEQQIRVLAYYDSLTSLPNRVFFKELLERAIAYAERHGQVMAVLFIDLDNFKRINDTLGHHEGDKLLQSVTNRLIGSTRGSDFIARWENSDVTDVISRLGGDEFILLLHNITDPLGPGKVAGRILKDLSEPFDLNGREVFLTASIGISLYPDDGKDVDDMLKNADVAMYHAKSKGRNNCQYYSKFMTSAALEYLTLKNKLHRAMEKEEFLIYYQPKQSLLDGRIIGLEGLLRWKPHDADLVPPSQFISLAEETGLIIPIGEWVLRTACLQNRAWQKAGYAPVVVSVNLSNRQFDQKDLIEVVTQALREAGLPPQYLELEITESAIMQDPDEAVNTLHKLKEMGVKIAIDDFGTGYSSLNYLRRIPLDFLKIDRSFVENIGKGAGDEAIIKAIITLAHSLRLKVIAEGVENERQLAFLRRLNCDEIQGYLLSPPLSAGEVSKLLVKDQADSGLSPVS